MSWVRTVLGQAQRQGIEENTLLRAAGIPLRELSAERWPIDHITRLWRAAARLTQDPGFGLKAGCHVSPASFNVLSFIVQSAPTLRQALVVVQKYQSLVSDGGRFQLLHGPQASWLVYHPRQGDLAFSPHQIEAVLAAVVSASRWVMRRPRAPLQVCFSHDAVGPLAGYREVFACPVSFGEAYSGLLLDNAVLDDPLPQANTQLARLHEQYAMSQLQALVGQEGLDTAVRRWIEARLDALAGHGLPTRAEAAQAVGLGDRTLGRRLQAAGTHFEQLLDEARRDRALHLVGHTTTPLREVAEALAYADISPFYRAFQRWTGQTPAAWRRQQHAGQALQHKADPTA
jgi:AraC-like DNA-binding protein